MLDKAFTATPAPEQRDAHWAARVRSQTTNPEWQDKGEKTEGFIVDRKNNNWFLRSGTDHKTQLTKQIENYLEAYADRGLINLGDGETKVKNRKWLLKSATHVETKAAGWMRANNKKELDVVINRDYICGTDFTPNGKGVTGSSYPGCYQAVAAILRQGQIMRVWLIGQEKPIIIRGTQ